MLETYGKMVCGGEGVGHPRGSTFPVSAGEACSRGRSSGAGGWVLGTGLGTGDNGPHVPRTVRAAFVWLLLKRTAAVMVFPC